MGLQQIVQIQARFARRLQAVLRRQHCQRHKLSLRVRQPRLPVLPRDGVIAHQAGHFARGERVEPLLEVVFQQGLPLGLGVLERPRRGLPAGRVR